MADVLMILDPTEGNYLKLDFTEANNYIIHKINVKAWHQEGSEILVEMFGDQEGICNVGVWDRNSPDSALSGVLAANKNLKLKPYHAEHDTLFNQVFADEQCCIAGNRLSLEEDSLLVRVFIKFILGRDEDDTLTWFELHRSYIYEPI